jgi:hypothetical protein
VTHQPLPWLLQMSLHCTLQIMAAGLFVSGCVLLLGATRLFGLVNRCVHTALSEFMLQPWEEIHYCSCLLPLCSLIPGAVVRGMQLGVGLQLAGTVRAWLKPCCGT